MSDPTIDQFMTKAPITIGPKQPLAEAHRLMNAHAIRHLPVLLEGRLVGIVSQRDLHLIETLKDVNPEEVEIVEAMSHDLFTVGPKTKIRQVAAEMAEHKYGAAVVTEKNRVVGIFTTIDALSALSKLLAKQHA